MPDVLKECHDIIAEQQIDIERLTIENKLLLSASEEHRKLNGKLRMELDEISNKDKVKDEDVLYIEKEFNDLLLGDGYASLFDYLRLKEFIRSIMNETN